jgi:DNA-binding NtrC family response regulator
MNRMPPHLTKAHAEQLCLYDWPGNIRELQNVIERALILSQGGQLQFELPKKNPDTPVSAVAGPAKIDSILTREEWKLREHESISQALKLTGGKIFGPGGAAELLRIKPTTLASRIKALGLNRKPMA